MGNLIRHAVAKAIKRRNELQQEQIKRLKENAFKHMVYRIADELGIGQHETPN